MSQLVVGQRFRLVHFGDNKHQRRESPAKRSDETEDYAQNVVTPVFLIWTTKSTAFCVGLKIGILGLLVNCDPGKLSSA